MRKRTLSIISLVIAGLVIISEIQWIGKSGIAIMIVGLAIAVAINALAEIIGKDE